MPFGDKGVIGTMIGALTGAERRAEEAASSASDRLGERLFGSTAESEGRNAQVIAPAASTQPTTFGRRSKGPDGNDPFRGDLAKADPENSEDSEDSEDSDKDKA